MSEENQKSKCITSSVPPLGSNERLFDCIFRNLEDSLCYLRQEGEQSTIEAIFNNNYQNIANPNSIQMQWAKAEIIKTIKLLKILYQDLENKKE